VVGWHIFYEGLSKLLNPNWTSLAYLMDSKGFFAGFFYELASNPSVLKAVDILNVWGLLIIGLFLMIGLFEKVTSIAGMILIWQKTKNKVSIWKMQKTINKQKIRIPDYQEEILSRG
jgi:uncharacterized membrane protein YphA (DoxX/SURF4 family)